MSEVRLKVQIHCLQPNWVEHENSRYRLYVNDDLITERTWIWHDFYIDESIQIEAPPGRYEVRYECLDPEHARLRIGDLRIETGPAIITKAGEIQIYTPETRNESQ